MPSALSIEIARRFVSAVVVIDDRAAFDERASGSSKAALVADTIELPPGPTAAQPTLTEASRFSASCSDDIDGGENSEEVTAGARSPDNESRDTSPDQQLDRSIMPGAVPHGGLIAPEVDTHRLSAAEVTEAFAHAGLICTILRPPTEEAIGELAVHAVKRADAVVLDWVLAEGEPPGQTARTILSALLRQDLQPVRLVCIYTGDPAIGGIASSLAAQFGGTLINDFEAIIASTKLSVLAKEGNSAASSRQVDFSALAERIVHEFADTADGLMPTFALASLGALRENSSPIMRRLKRLMDSAFLGHRMMLKDPGDSLRHVTDSFSDELNSILAADRLVAASLGFDYVLERSKELRRTDTQLRQCDARFSQNMPKELDTLIRDGGAKVSWASKLHAGTDEDAYCSDLWFAELLQARSYYGPDPPILTLGVVLRQVREIDPVYYLCFQPVCDSVRMQPTSSRRFPLLPLSIAINSVPKFVVDDGGIPVPLTTKIKLFESVLKSFRCNNASSGTVDAVVQGGRWRFEDDEKAEYIYVTRLREFTSQKIAFDLGLDTSRIGVDEPEWIRAGGKAAGPPGSLPTQ